MRKALLISLAFAAAAGLAATGGRHWRGPRLAPKRVAVLPIVGPIEDAQWAVHWLRRYQGEVRGVKAVVLALDSPGGGVAPSQEIFEMVRDLRAGHLVVVAAMGSVAASGAYYIACGADRIVANPGTLTGSIGVLMETMSAKGLLDKVGLRLETVKSGEFKDSGGWDRPLSPRERQVFQATIDDVQDQFVSAVALERRNALAEAYARESGRKAAGLSNDDIYGYVASLADGRVYTGRQAYDLGLVDRLGTLEDAITLAADLAGLKDPEVITHREPRSWGEWITGMSRADWSAWVRRTLSASPRPGLHYLMR